GGVHSHEDHLLAMIDMARREGVREVAVHAFLDGRDMPPRSAAPSLRRLQAACDAAGNARIATVSGRYFAMDRDRRWDRVRKAWDAMVEAHAAHAAPSASEALEAAYARGENDEFVDPTVIDAGAPVRDGDAVVFMNFRADRARQLTAAFRSAMDRDRRWDRVRKAWDAMVEAHAAHAAPSASEALEAAYARGENDEFVDPTVIDAGAPVRDGDAVVFMNFRADRARQLTAAF